MSIHNSLPHTCLLLNATSGWKLASGVALECFWRWIMRIGEHDLTAGKSTDWGWIGKQYWVRRGPRLDRVAAERVNLLLKCMSDRSINFCYRLRWTTLFQNISAQTAGGKSWWCCEPRGVTSQVLQKKPEMTRWRIGSEVEPHWYTITTKQEVPSRNNVPHCPHQYIRTCREKNLHTWNFWGARINGEGYQRHESIDWILQGPEIWLCATSVKQ